MNCNTSGSWSLTLKIGRGLMPPAGGSSSATALASSRLLPLLASRRRTCSLMLACSAHAIGGKLARARATSGTQTRMVVAFRLAREQVEGRERFTPVLVGSAFELQADQVAAGLRDGEGNLACGLILGLEIHGQSAFDDHIFG